MARWVDKGYTTSSAARALPNKAASRARSGNELAELGPDGLTVPEQYGGLGPGRGQM